MNKKILALAVSGLFLSTSAIADEASWTGLKIGIGGGGKYNAAKSTISSSHDTSHTSENSVNSITNQNFDDGPGGPYSNGNDYGTGDFSFITDYAASEFFSGDASGTSDLGKAQGFATLDASFDWQLNDTVVFGIIANYDMGGKSRTNGQAAGGASAGWEETYNQGTYDYTAPVSEGTTGSCFSEGCPASNITTINGVAHNLNNGSNNVSRTGMTSSFETGDSAALGARLGLIANKNTLFYATGGWTTIKVKQNVSYSSTVEIDGAYSDFGSEGDSNSYDYTNSSSSNGNKNGYFLGAGVQTKVTEHISAKLEYRYSDFGTLRNSTNNNDVSITSNGTNNQHEFGTLYGSSSISQETNLNQHAIRAVVSYDF